MISFRLPREPRSQECRCWQSRPARPSAPFNACVWMGPSDIEIPQNDSLFAGCRSTFRSSEATPQRSPCTSRLILYLLCAAMGPRVRLADVLVRPLLRIRRWGESAGAISVALHLLTNGGNTEGLFRGAFMQSGSPIPTGDITNGQADYDGLVAATGCSGASDTLQCLREVDFDTLQAAVDATPNIFSYQVMAAVSSRAQHLLMHYSSRFA